MTPEIERLGMTDEEVAAVAEIFADELARGWIPKRADIEDTLEVVRAANGCGHAETPAPPVMEGRA